MKNLHKSLKEFKDYKENEILSSLNENIRKLYRANSHKESYFYLCDFLNHKSYLKVNASCKKKARLLRKFIKKVERFKYVSAEYEMLKAFTIETLNLYYLEYLRLNVKDNLMPPGEFLETAFKESKFNNPSSETLECLITYRDLKSQFKKRDEIIKKLCTHAFLRKVKKELNITWNESKMAIIKFVCIMWERFDDGKDIGIYLDSLDRLSQKQEIQ